MTSEPKAAILAEALSGWLPSLTVEVIPVSAPVASIGVRVSYPGVRPTTYTPALQVWWAFDDELADLVETTVADSASLAAVSSLVVFDVGMHLLDAELIAGREKSADGDLFGAVVNHLLAVADDDGDDAAASMASLYLTLLNAELADAQNVDELVVDNS